MRGEFRVTVEIYYDEIEQPQRPPDRFDTGGLIRLDEMPPRREVFLTALQQAEELLRND